MLAYLTALCSTADDSVTQNASENVRQWLQLIRDENSLSSQDLLSSSDTYSFPDTSTISQNTLHSQDEVESVVTADGAHELSEVAAEEKNLKGSLGDDMRQFVSTRSGYQELSIGNYVRTKINDKLVISFN